VLEAWYVNSSPLSISSSNEH
jgi:trypsin